MITPSFSITATERVLPKLTIDFTTASLDPRITFTRALNTATVTNSSGNVVGINANLPRFDYDPIALTCKGLLIEETRSNLFSYSSDYNNAVWGLSRCTSNGTSEISPDGTSNGSKFTCTATNAGGFFATRNSAITISGTTQTGSFYTKKGTSNWAYCLLWDSSGNGVRQWFNLNTISLGSTINVGTWTIISATITSVGNGWIRCTLSVNSSGTAGNFNIYPSVSGDGAYGCTIGDIGYLWGVQFETGEFSTSYIPTTTTSLTRNADVATMTGTNFSNWFYATEGGAVAQAILKSATGTKPVVQFDDATANQSISLRGSATDPQLYVVNGGLAQATLDAGTIAANTTYNFAGAWKSANYGAAINGNAAVSQLSGTYPTVTQARLGSDGTDYLNGWLKSLRYWPQRISNAEVQAFSK